MTDDIRVFVIQALAAFDGPSQVVEMVKQEYGVQMTPQAVQAYDPTKYSGRNLKPKWKAIFEKARKAFVEDASDIPIAHRSTRLRALQRMAAKAEAKGNFPLAAQLHKQAAEEMGNAYTNRREITGKDGKDLPAPPPAVAIFALPDNSRDSGPKG
ncbi:DUF2280 domain-containing protein [Novosphingobium sp. 28-62-57]|uniref:DUF2280 domain-containing protein n=1 Tax=Novosphingobium sp. 28-62-57 TaxID=1970409 RepID=UPI0026001602|nr:DUF2280 domain-containing protein [Novosphingobium sp. 28-62-57]